MRRPTILDRIMAEPIHFPGFPQIIVTRGFAYQFLKGCGWDELERGYGSLDCTVFMPPPTTEPLTDAAERDYWLGQVRHDFVREPPPLYIRIHSHSARKRIDAVIGKRQCYFSMKRKLGHGGCYLLSPEDIARIAHVKGWTRLRGASEDIMPCIDYGVRKVA